ncbi:hypothetical protein GCM10009740_15770 [Terrabacter terrae]|uniref:Ribbon-helix-helix protein CopG domain-containing protein n=1 Tax=Terrabacter terrae TaxID=318434 RepID=A0ABN2U3D0_9MICO
MPWREARASPSRDFVREVVADGDAEQRVECSEQEAEFRDPVKRYDKSEHSAEVRTNSQSEAGAKDVVRLSVNLASDVAGALKALSFAQGVSVTEGVRRAIALWKLLSDERAGHNVMVVEGEGDKARYRELIIR